MYVKKIGQLPKNYKIATIHIFEKMSLVIALATKIYSLDGRTIVPFYTLVIIEYCVVCSI